MNTYVDMYNNLPTISQADAHFVDRDITFAQLAPLLSKYNHQFGICLLHAHCALNPGEKMIATGDVCEPVDPPTGFRYYPERWLSNGEPFEYTTSPTSSPPAELLSEFKRVVGGAGVLGLYFAGASDGELWIERTEGRRNIMEVVSRLENPEAIETAWLPGTANLVRAVCFGCH
jgi:hypothetical protein